VYNAVIKRIERGEAVVIDAAEFTVTQLMMLARAAHAHRAQVRICNGPFRVEDAMAVRRAGRGHVEYAGPKAA
jgi:3-methyladenine DNA glycosylase Mpg